MRRSGVMQVCGGIIGGVLLSSVAAAKPCPNEQPRLFPPPGSELPAEGRIVILVRPELSDALAALEKAKLTLDSPGRPAVPLKREDDKDLRSAEGERVLIFRAPHVIQPGRTYQLGHLPKLPPAWESLGAARWQAVASHRKPPEIPTKKTGRTYCAALSADARVCGIALFGKSTADTPLLMSALLRPTDDKIRGKLPTFVDIIVPGGELVLHNQTCDAEMSGLVGGKYEATFALTDAAGRKGAPWKTTIEVRDLNDEMSKISGAEH